VAGWTGWAADYLKLLGVPNTAANRRFLNEWESAQHTSCRNNPLSSHMPWAGSTVCIPEVTQAYLTHSNGLHATEKQMKEPSYAAILNALKSGNPFTFTNWTNVAHDLDTWGATLFAQQYRNEVVQAGTGSSVGAAKAHSGWADIRRSFNRNAHPALVHAAHLRKASLRRLARAHRLSG
jgi:hypothetical protein